MQRLTTIFFPHSKPPWFLVDDTGDVIGEKEKILEISSRSHDPLGKALSPMNLKVTVNRLGEFYVESLYQGSKKFGFDAGPFTDLYEASGWAAKRDTRIRVSGALRGFELMGKEYPLEPKSIFYDWIWIIAFMQHGHRLLWDFGDFERNYDGFMDMFYNSRTVACQARSAAIFCGMIQRHGRDYITYENMRIWEQFQTLYTTGEFNG